jgi:hypothetical protein
MCFFVGLTRTLFVGVFMSHTNNPYQQLEQAISNTVRANPMWLTSEKLAEIATQEMHLERYFFEKYFTYSRAKAVSYAARSLVRSGILQQCYSHGTKQPVSLWKYNQEPLDIPPGCWR